MQDFDNDGWPDLYFSAAWLDSRGEVTPLVFRHVGLERGIPRFEPLRQISAGEPNVYFPAGPSGDYDGDGSIDLFLGNWFSGNYSRLLKNVSGGNRWLEVSVRGKTTNRMGIGTKVSVFKAGELRRASALLGRQEIGTGYGYASGQVPVAHFGLGGETNIDLVMTFPDGSANVLRDVQANRRLNLDGR